MRKPEQICCVSDLAKDIAQIPFTCSFPTRNGKEIREFLLSGRSRSLKLGKETGISVAELSDEFYDRDLRNAISHSDFILTSEHFRCRGGSGAWRGFSLSLERLNEIITKAKVFVGTFFSLDRKLGEVGSAQAPRHSL